MMSMPADMAGDMLNFAARARTDAPLEWLVDALLRVVQGLWLIVNPDRGGRALMERSAPYCALCGGPTEERDTHGRLRPVCTVCGQIVYFDPKVAVVVFIGDASACCWCGAVMILAGPGRCGGFVE